MFFLTSSDCSITSKPATLALPADGGRKQVRTRMVVVFPAPFLPRKPTISPLPTSKEIFLTATLRAYRLVRPSTLIIDVMIDGLLAGTVTAHRPSAGETMIPGFMGFVGRGLARGWKWG